MFFVLHEEWEFNTIIDVFQARFVEISSQISWIVYISNQNGEVPKTAAGSRLQHVQFKLNHAFVVKETFIRL